jgi:tetratricopeptide (TPR) repeat protein
VPRPLGYIFLLDALLDVRERPTMMRACGPVCVAVCVTVLALGCSRKADKEETLMRAGLEAMYTRHDPNEAAAKFRQVLEYSPAHYAATYQLALALDATGQTEAARPIWERVLTMATAANDRQTADTARAHLGSEETLMRAGLEALYKQGDPNAAVVQFRKVLERNPLHYGATYQLAAALDAAGKSDEARPLWERVLTMAEKYNDPQTAGTARKHLHAK